MIPNETKNLSWKDAWWHLLNGKKIKRPLWDGYWVWENNTIMMHCRDGSVTDIRGTEFPAYTFSKIAQRDWMVVEDGDGNGCRSQSRTGQREEKQMAKLEIPVKVDIYKIEELIDQLKQLQTYKLFAGDEMTLVDRDEVVEIITDHVKAEVSPPDQRWTPCCEQMPKEFGYYLCWYEYYHVSKNKVLPEYGIGYYDPEMEFWSGEVRQGRGAKVLAWTFLPDPWEGEQNG